MKPARVLFLIDVLSSTKGGAEGVLLRTTRLLPRDRYSCDVATFSPDASVVPVHEFDCPVYRFPISRTYDLKAIGAAIELASLIRREKYSIVHTFFPASDILGGVVAKLCGCPALISSRRDMGLLRTRAHWIVYRMVRRMFDQVHAVSDQVRAFHIEHDLLSPSKVVTLNNGVDIDALDRAPATQWPEEFGLTERNRVVVCVANVRPVKGLEVLVRTAATVVKASPETRFLVIGAAQDTDYFNRVVMLAHELGVSRHIIFARARTDVASLLKQSDIFYLPSHSEGLSNAMLEAMTCSLPCVATNVGGNGELICNQVNGHLIAPNDAAAGARAIIRLLNDEDLRRNMGRAGRRIVESKFSMQVMVDRLVGLYDQLLCEQEDRGLVQASSF